MVKRKPYQMVAAFTGPNQKVEVGFKSVGPVRNGLAEFSYEVHILTADSTRHMAGTMADVPVPGSWNHLTARFFAMYPEFDFLGRDTVALVRPDDPQTLVPQSRVWRNVPGESVPLDTLVIPFNKTKPVTVTSRIPGPLARTIVGFSDGSTVDFRRGETIYAYVVE